MKKSRFALLGITVLLLILLLSLIPASKTNATRKPHLSDHHAVHNMLVVGEKTIYLSHLPMFQEIDSPLMPHRYQAILEVEFQQQGSHPQDDYRKDRQGHSSTKIYTINPRPFVLPTLVSSGLQGEPVRKFQGGIFRGHLEKGGTRILSNIDVNVKRVVYFQKFDSIARRPAQLEYLLFGKGEELFLAHLIVAPPDFDQVVSVKVPNHKFNEEELAKGIRVVFRGTANTPSLRLKEKQQAEGELNFVGNIAPQKVKVTINREFYFEEGELRTPPKFGTTPEEKKTGFL